jgi:hypothetical protein
MSTLREGPPTPEENPHRLFLAGAPQIVGRISDFVFYRVVRSGKDSHTATTLAASFERWSTRYEQLQLIASRCATVSHQFVTAINAHMASGSLGSRPLTEAEVTFLNIQRHLTLALHLEIETFYLLAKILLDRIADTFAYAFDFPWKAKGSTHEKLFHLLPKIVKDKGLSAPPATLYGLLRETRDLVVTYRDDHIEHVAVGIQRGTVWSPAKGLGGHF